MATTNVATALPDLVLPPGATITVDTGNASCTISLLNVYGVTPETAADTTVDELQPAGALFVYESQ